MPVEAASPWAHCATALLTGDPVEGTWFDRTQEWSARQRGVLFEPRKFASTEKAFLSPLPCWRHLAPERYRALVAGLVEQIEARPAAVRAATGVAVIAPLQPRRSQP